MLALRNKSNTLAVVIKWLLLYPLKPRIRSYHRCDMRFIGIEGSSQIAEFHQRRVRFIQRGRCIIFLSMKSWHSLPRQPHVRHHNYFLRRQLLQFFKYYFHRFANPLDLLAIYSTIRQRCRWKINIYNVIKEQEHTVCWCKTSV